MYSTDFYRGIAAVQADRPITKDEYRYGSSDFFVGVAAARKAEGNRQAPKVSMWSKAKAAISNKFTQARKEIKRVCYAGAIGMIAAKQAYNQVKFA